MKRQKLRSARSEARAKAFLKQVNVKKERNLTKAYMALKSSVRSNAKNASK